MAAMTGSKALYSDFGRRRRLGLKASQSTIGLIFCVTPSSKPKRVITRLNYQGSRRKRQGLLDTGLSQLQSRLKKDKALFRDYDHIIREQEREGIVEQTIINENDGYFLPHHGVIRQDKETTKLRIVFDGSAKPSEDDLSLNECWNNLIHFASICMYYFGSFVVRCSVFGFILSRLNIYCYGELA